MTLAFLKNVILALPGVVTVVAQLFSPVMSSPSDFQTPFRPDELVTEYKENPIGIDVIHPRLSWKISTPDRGWQQSAYQVQVAGSIDQLISGGQLIWDSSKVTSGDSVHREYAGPALQSSARYYWRVRVWDEADDVSDWSNFAYWEMGLLEETDWVARWITPDWESDSSVSQPALLFRGALNVTHAVRSARVYVTSRGLYEMSINGQRVSEDLFTPGWTAYHTRIQYQTYDVTDLLQQGSNILGVTVGDGWYRGPLMGGSRNHYGDRLGLLAQVRIEYTDGNVEIFGTDEQWKASTGPIQMSEIYQGEIYDARLERQDWTRSDYEVNDWQAVRLFDTPPVQLIAPAGPPVRRIEEIRPIEILRTPNGEVVLDLGQNMVGWVKLTVDANGAPAGQRIVLRHAEVLGSDGNLYTDNLRAAKQQVEYILDGTERGTVFEPHFTFHGFQYVAIDGYPGDLTVDDVAGVVVHSNMQVTGEFETSDARLNQLQRNILWGQKGNFLDVPTDCPQRDERLGWTGDAQVFCRTATFNMQVAPFFTKWLGDLSADQAPNGSIPPFVPDYRTNGGQGMGATGWADAGVIIPWTIYLAYGDERILLDQYESMQAWVKYMHGRAGEDLVWTGDFHYGDWLAYATTDPGYPGATTDTDGIATAFFAHSTGLLAKMARILGRAAEADEYEALRARIVEAYQREFVTVTGRVAENTQTAYVLALQFDLLPESLRPIAAQRLVDDIRSRGNHLTTGFLGTPYLNHVLTRFGYVDVAYDLLLQDTYPSWLYPVTQGATTIWERWDGRRPDGSFQSAGMNSFNHYAYGAVGDWMYQTVAGLDTDSSGAGYKHVKIHPHPGGNLTYAGAAFDSMYGHTESRWDYGNDGFTLRVTIPANTTATVRLPNAANREITESGLPVEQAVGVTSVEVEERDIVIGIGSGQYTFLTRN